MSTQIDYKIPAELKDLIPGYLSRRDQDIQALKTFALNNDYISVSKLGHKLKGNGSSFGFNYITEKGSLLMLACEQKNMLEIKKIISDLESEIFNIKKYCILK